jgi:hypothetical protein
VPRHRISVDDSRELAGRSVTIDGSRHGQFLKVLANHKIELSPPILIDTAWHEALIDTVNYRNFCREFFGATLDHHPPISDEDFRLENFDLTRKTVEFAREMFGHDLETLVWRRSKRVQVLAQAY